MLQVKATGQSGHIMPIWLPLPEVAKMFVKLEPRAGSGAVSKWVICACDSLVDFGTV